MYRILRYRQTQLFALSLLSTLVLVGCQSQQRRLSTEFVRYGSMHETIGQKQHQGRVGLAEIVKRPHFYAVGALEGLRGEITIQDSVAMVTGVRPDGSPQSLAPADLQAALLAGQSVEAWTSVTLADAVPHDGFDQAVATMAAGKGIDTAAPFMFMVDGEFTDVRLHVIHGACPVHARMKNITLDKGEQPYEMEAERVSGTLVGVYAADAVGKLTHPATSTHVHLIYEDRETGEIVTGHLERVGLAAGAVVKLPTAGMPGVTASAR